MYCDLKGGAREAVCIAIQTRRAVGTRQRALGRGAEAGSRGTQAGRAAEARGEGSTGERGARQGRWALGLGVLLGCGLCTWCTQPVFYPV